MLNSIKICKNFRMCVSKKLFCPTLVIVNKDHIMVLYKILSSLVINTKNNLNFFPQYSFHLFHNLKIVYIFQMIASRPWLMASTVGTQFRKAYHTFVHFHRRVLAGVYRKWREEIDLTFIEQFDKRVLIETSMVNQCRAFVVGLDK